MARRTWICIILGGLAFLSAGCGSRLAPQNPLQEPPLTGGALYLGGPFPGPTPAGIPGVIEVANYDTGGLNVAYYCSNGGGTAGVYRSDSANNIETTQDTLNISQVGGGYDMGWSVVGEWMKYTVNVTAGTYTISVRVACQGNGGNFHIMMDSTNISGPLTIPNTGGWQNWQTVTGPSVTLAGGQHIMELYVDSQTTAIGNFHWIQIQ